MAAKNNLLKIKQRQKTRAIAKQKAIDSKKAVQKKGAIQKEKPVETNSLISDLPKSSIGIEQKPATSTDKVSREDDKKRKQKSVGKRKGSGLKLKSIYLHDNTYDRFEELAQRFGYDLGVKGLSSEQLSMLVHFLLDAYERPESISVPLTYNGQYLYRLHQILKYRSKTMHDTVNDISEFMSENKYSVPDEFATHTKYKKSSKYLWTNQIVESLLNSNKVSEIISQSSIISLSKAQEVSTGTPNTDLDSLDAPFDESEYDDGDNLSLDEDFSERSESVIHVLEALQDEQLYENFSKLEFGKILTEDEIFKKLGIEKKAIIDRIKDKHTETYEDDDEYIDFDD